MIDRVFTKARGALHPERRAQHGRHGAPDAHRRPRRVLLPAVPVRRGDAGHADRALGVLRPARLRARRAGPARATRTCARRSSPAATRSSAASSRDVRSIDLAPTAAFLLDIPAPQQSQGVVRRDMLDDGRRRTRRCSIIGLNDFHGQLDADHDARSTTLTATVGGARAAGDDVRRGGRARCPARRCCWRPATTSARHRRTRRCCEDLPGDRRRERVGARRHELRQPRVRLRRRAHPRAHEARANFPFLSANIVEEDTGEAPDWVKASTVLPRQRRARRRDRRDGQDDARARARPAPPRACEFLDEAERIRRESRAPRARWA